MRRRAAVFKRGGYLCERCRSRVAEEVHHLDGNPANNRMENLLGCCHQCHMELEAEKRDSAHRA